MNDKSILIVYRLSVLNSIGIRSSSSGVQRSMRQHRTCLPTSSRVRPKQLSAHCRRMRGNPSRQPRSDRSRISYFFIIDFLTMSRFVTSQYWRRITPAQQDEFVGLFKDQHIHDRVKLLRGQNPSRAYSWCRHSGTESLPNHPFLRCIPWTIQTPLLPACWSSLALWGILPGAN